MNEFCAMPAEELDQVDGGIVPVIAAGFILLAGCIDSDTTDIEGREPLPGFNNFLDDVANISRLSGGVDIHCRAGAAGPADGTPPRRLTVEESTDGWVLDNR